jgi:hypothetical protein
MTAALSLPVPGGRVLLGWWHDLAAVSPRRLWLAHLLVHRVEALVRVTHSRPLDRLQQGLLALLPSAATRSPNSGPHAPGLDPQVRTRLLHELAAEGLARVTEGSWHCTETGRQALAGGAFVARSLERRVFSFVDNAPCGRPPHFLPLGSTVLGPAPTGENWRFDPALLQACVEQAPDWKARHRFPAEVEAVLAAPPGMIPSDWRQVMVDRPEQALLVLVLASAESGGETLLGFTVRSEGWTLSPQAPVLALTEGWREGFPDLAEEPAEDAWRQAWLAWCQPRSLPPAEVEACKLERIDHRLRVQAPNRLVERLKAARSDALKGEAWLLAGTGRCRAAALVEIVAPS